ncbi:MULTISPECIES: hypothetical protein [Bacillus]|uniref:hypothetical protein n=1 Tax=Bacillus TaxID=1386 RepID=UPI000BB75E04|nr:MULTISPECIES: hypothetical protein [Bacillus]
MAFGIKRAELMSWKRKVENGDIAFITHYWVHPKFPHIHTVTKVGCCDIEHLVKWGEKYGLKSEWIHNREQFPHFDLIGEKQLEILEIENQWDQINKFLKRK